MNEIPLSVLLAALVLLVILSGLFSASETGMMALNRYRLRHLAKHGHHGAQRASRLLERPDRLIGLILLGNNFVNILASSIATLMALRIGGEEAIALATGLLTFVVLVGIILSHARLVGEVSGIAPILLLDEIGAHLDEGRRAALFGILRDLDCQHFMTGTEPALFADVADGLFLNVSGGTVETTEQR